MFVALGNTFEPHRAHLVHGLLECHGIQSFVWGGHQANIWGTGVLTCSVVVDDEDLTAACEVMNGPHEEMPSIDEREEVPQEYQSLPDFLSCFQVALGSVTFCVGLWAFSQAAILLVIGRVMTAIAGLSANIVGLMVLVLVVVLECLLWAVCLQVMLLPFRLGKGKRWMALLAFLLVFALIGVG
jgi:Putative prokaryotic signal transducing protein